MDMNVKMYIASAILLVLFCVLLPLYMRKTRSEEGAGTRTGRKSADAGAAGADRESSADLGAGLKKSRRVA